MLVREKTCSAAIESALNAISGKWKGSILYQLMHTDELRFGMLKDRLSGVTQRILTKQLRELEAAGLISRTVYAEVPRRVEYKLTAEGEALRLAIEELRAWGVRRNLGDQSPPLGERT